MQGDPDGGRRSGAKTTSSRDPPQRVAVPHHGLRPESGRPRETAGS
jgi:hypothetical protein